MTGSYGILNVDPVGRELAPRVDPFQKAMSAATGIYDLFGKHYENKLKSSQANMSELEAQQKASTLPGLIQSINAKSAADTLYYPQQQQANLGHTKAQIQEVMSKTGLNFAESKAALARATDSYASAGLHNANARDVGLGKNGQLLNAYNSAPAGSDAQKYYGALLRKEMGGYAPGGAGQSGGASSQGAVGGAMMMGPDGLMKNPMGGGPRASFHQYTNPETGETMESPTMASGTRNQTRVEANAEMKMINPIITKGFQPYLGKLGSAKLTYDSYLASSEPNSAKGKEAAQRLYNYSLADRFKREAASTISRQTTGMSPGVEAAREQEQSSFGNLPGKFSSSFIPQSIQSQSLQNYIPTQEKVANEAIKAERQNYGAQGAQPSWAANQGGAGQLFGGGQQPQAVPGGGFNGNPNVQPPQAQPQQKQPQFPTAFESESQAKEFYQKLSPEEQARYRASLGNR